MIDFDLLLSPAVQAAFGLEATYRRTSPVLADDVDTEITITAVFDFSDATQIRTNGAAEAWVRESEFGGVPAVKGDIITYGTETYNVVDVRPASKLPAAEGGRVLELRKTPSIV